MLLQAGENTTGDNNILMGKVAENNILWIIAFLPIKHFSLTPLGWFLIFKFLVFRFFS